MSLEVCKKCSMLIDTDYMTMEEHEDECLENNNNK